MRQRKTLLGLLFIAACVAGAVLGLGVRAARVRANQTLYRLDERFGLCVAPVFPGISSFPGSVGDFGGLEALGAGWYSDWRLDADPETLGGLLEYAQLLETKHWPPSWTEIEQVAQARPGSLWMIGNEPETRGQGEHTPAEYAEIYHAAHTFLKTVDPSARIAVGGIVMPTPLRLKWLEECLDHYQATYAEPMPIDVWNIHLQILQEHRYDWGCGVPFGLEEDVGRTYEIIDNCSVPVFETLVVEFCTWLAERGERDKPLIISEYGVLMPSGYLPRGDQSVLGFMNGTFDLMLHRADAVLGWQRDQGRLVQRWLWFSLNFPFYERTPGGFNGALYDWERPEEPTVFGQYYKRYTEKESWPERVSLPLLHLGRSGAVPTKTIGQPTKTVPVPTTTLTADKRRFLNQMARPPFASGGR